MFRRTWAIILVVAMLTALLPATLALAAGPRTTRCNLRLRAKATSSSDTLATVPAWPDRDLFDIGSGPTDAATGASATEHDAGSGATP